MLRRAVLLLRFVLSVCSIMLPLATCAQQPELPVIGYLSSASLPDVAVAFRQGLNETGYFEGKMWSSKSAERKVTMSDCQSWRPSWCTARWR